MPPSRQSCEIIASAYEAAAEIIDKLSSIKNTVLNAVKVRNALKYGINLTDAIGGELAAAIGSVASQVATTLLKTTSSVASNVMEGVLNKILQILLAFPTSIFSLVAIPHEAAKDAVYEEQKFLRLAQNNLRTVLRLILKWTQGLSGQQYYEQIRDALPFIQNAINLAASMVRELENDDNAFFDETKYKEMRNSLSQAIAITKPFSVIDNTLQVSSRLEQDKNRIYSAKAREINDQYRKDKRDATTKYQRDLIAARAGGAGNDSALNTIANATSTHYQNILYQNRLRDLENKKKRDLAVAKSEAEIEAIKNSSLITRAVNDVIGDFANDMQIMQEQLTRLLSNTKDAFLKYKESQVLCGNIYDSRNLIRGIITQMISLIRTSSNVAGQGLSEFIEGAQGLMENVRDDFQDDADRYVASDSGISSAEMSLDVVLGHGQLSAAEQLLNASVTDSLIELINSDDVLQDSNEEFERFIDDIANISDWDGQRNVWAVDILNSATSPYIQLIADGTEALAKIPALSVTGKESDKTRVRSLIRNIDDNFRELVRHNVQVNNVLSSYTPYMASEAGDLRAILSGAGLLRNFALTMSLTTLSADLLSLTKGELGDIFPSYEQCRSAYPDLFDNLDLATAAVASEQDMPAEQESIAYQENVEDKELYRNGARKAIDTTNFNTLVKDLSDLKDSTNRQAGDLVTPVG